MTLHIRALHPTIGGEATGIDLRRPPSPAEIAAIEAGMDRHAVLVFPNQDIDDAMQVAFSRHFGPIEAAVGGDLTKAEEKRLSLDFADVSNLDRNQEIKPRDDRHRLFGLANRLWHSDSSFRAVPAKYSLLSGRIVPARGGNTEFADMRAAYDALDASTQALIEDLVCEHSLLHSRGSLGFPEPTAEERELWRPVLQRLVRTHPVSGRRSLYLSAHAGAIVGMATPAARILLRDLTEHATRTAFVYAHEWRVGDLVMWDNRCTMHRRNAFDPNERRYMLRTQIRGARPSA